MLGLLAILVVAAVVLLVWRPWEAGSAPEPAPAPSGTPAATPDAQPSPTSTEPFTPIGGTPQPTGAPTAPCAAESVRLTPATDREEYGDGERVQLSFTIENTGDAACSVNAGTAQQQYEVRAGDQVVYRFTDCAADVQDDVVQLEPATPQSSVPVEWDRTPSSTETCTAERDQVPADGATYELRVSVGGYASQGGATFVLR